MSPAETDTLKGKCVQTDSVGNAVHMCIFINYLPFSQVVCNKRSFENSLVGKSEHFFSYFQKGDHLSFKQSLKSLISNWFQMQSRQAPGLNCHMETKKKTLPILLSFLFCFSFFFFYFSFHVCFYGLVHFFPKQLIDALPVPLKNLMEM